MELPEVSIELVVNPQGVPPLGLERRSWAILANLPRALVNLGWVLWTKIHLKESPKGWRHLFRRQIDVCLVQEVMYRRGHYHTKKGKYKRFKLFWSGNNNGVGVFVAEQWVVKVLKVQRSSDRIILYQVCFKTTKWWGGSHNSWNRCYVKSSHNLCTSIF